MAYINGNEVLFSPHIHINENAVSFTEQELTEEQKAQARDNIDAASKDSAQACFDAAKAVLDEEMAEYVTDAKSAKTGAESARDEARKAKTEAETARDAAEFAQSAAETATKTAQTHATQANESKSAAAASASSALTHVNTAIKKADQATLAAENATKYMNNALQYKNEAQSHANKAETNAGYANTHAQKAESHSTTASKARDAASNSATAAATSATAAAQSASQVKQMLNDAPKTFASALRGEKSGTRVYIDNAEQNPLDMSLSVRVKSKNIIKYPFAETTKVSNGITFEDKGDGSITVKDTSDKSSTQFILADANSCPFEAGKTYILGASDQALPTGMTLNVFYKDADGVQKSLGSGKTFTWGDGFTLVKLILYVANSGTTFSNAVVYPQVQEGTQQTQYTPYVADLTTEQVAFYDKEGLDFTYIYPDANGIVDGGAVYNPGTWIDGGGNLTVTVTYNKDINYAFAELQQAIISLGGNV